MAIAGSARIHPSAIIHPQAEIGDEAQVGPFALIDGPARIGAGTVIGASVHILGRVAMGINNVVHSHAVIGGEPQHLKYAGEPTTVEIGDHNTLREHVTIHRGMAGATRLGSNNLLMASSHLGHDSVVGNNCVLANGALVAGHAVLEDRVTLSGNAAVHQFVRMGRLSLLSGLSGMTMDVPPFTIHQRINVVCGVNVIGMRRAGISNGSIDAVRKAFAVLYRSGQLVRASVAQLEQQMGHVPEVMELVSFIRAAKRGITVDLDREAA
ncbi:MAG: acyl-ACP--UDP-N-acetylglucosamine O-acyltransferase [Gemmataceae bacterium]|nr:acyl-ACP--UDP-N-acetylglucosamine O-acyltransferase [Gemmataceae bacterium]